MMAARAVKGVCAAALVAVSGCATPGPREALKPVEADRSTWASWTASAPAAPVTENWLADLDDPATTGVVREALSNNFNLQATGARSAAVLNQARGIRAGLLPSITGNLNGNRRGGPQVFNGINFGNQFQTVYSTGFALNWELDVWGRLADGTRAAYLDAAAQQLDFAAAQLSLAGNTATAHYDLIAATLQRQLAERDVATGEANLRIIERRYSRGISTSVDLRLARSSLASSEATRDQRSQEELEAARRLEVFLGRYPGGQMKAPELLPDVEGLPGTTSNALGTPEELLSRRPDVIAAERRLKAAGLRVSEARKAFLPSLSISASVTQNAVGPAATNSVADINDLWDFNELAKNLAGNLTQPLFQGGRLIATERQRAAEARAALYEYGETALTAWREVEDAIAAETFLAKRQAASATAFEEAEAAEELTERRYLAGTTNIFDLIDAQQRRINAEGSLINAQRERLVNRINLYLALGAPFAPNGDETETVLDVTAQTADAGAAGNGDAS